MKLPCFLLLALVLVAPGRAADPVGSALRTGSGAAGITVRSADATRVVSANDADPTRIADQLAPDHQPDSVRFEAVDVFVDSGDKPLAAYQFELKARSGEVLLAGLEGGEHAAFKAAPYYDTTALLQNKVIVAAFSTAPELPHGRTRVARLMVQVTGPAEPAYDATLSVAGSTDGKPIADAKLSIATERADTATAPDTSKPSQTPNASEGVVR